MAGAVTALRLMERNSRTNSRVAALRAGSFMHGDAVEAARLILIGASPARRLKAALGGTMSRLGARANFGYSRGCTTACAGRGRGAFPDLGSWPRDGRADLSWYLSSGLAER